MNLVLAKVLAFGEITASGLTDAQATSLSESLQAFGGMLLDNFIKLLPALAVFAAIWFVIKTVKKKVRA